MGNGQTDRHAPRAGSVQVSWPQCPRLSKVEPADIAACIFGEAGAVAADSIHKGRHTLTRMLNYMEPRDLCFDNLFGTLPEVDLYGFLLTVHHTAVLNGTDRRPGFTAVWGVFNGLVYLKKHLKFPLPTDEVRNTLPQRGKKTGAGALLKGALALPPEVLQALCDYAALPDTPQVLASYTYALIHIYTHIYMWYPPRGKKTGAGALLEGALALPPEALQALCDYAALPDKPQVLASYTYALIHIYTYIYIYVYI